MTSQEENPSAYILSLVKDALNDLDKMDVSLSTVIRKCIRISRLRNDYINLLWLSWEMKSPLDKNFNNEIFREIAPHLTNKEFASYKKIFALEWINERKITTVNEHLEPVENQVSNMSVGEIEVSIVHNKQLVEKSFPPEGLHPLDLYFDEISKEKNRYIMNTLIIGHEMVLERIKQRVHKFLSDCEKQLLFGQLMSDIFNKNRQYVDQRLEIICPEAVSKFISIYKRMEENDKESYSQALTSCRRIIKDLADALCPPSAETFIGEFRKTNQSKYLYTINTII